MSQKSIRSFFETASVKKYKDQTPALEIEVSSVNANTKRRRISTSSEEENNEEITACSDSGQLSLDKDKSTSRQSILEGISDEDTPIPSSEISLTPNGTVCRKTARKSALSSKKSRLSQIKNLNLKVYGLGTDSIESAVTETSDAELKNLETRSKPDDTAMEPSIHFKEANSSNIKVPFKTRNKASLFSKTKRESTSFDYCPGKYKYHPIEDACWNPGEKVPYYALARTFGVIEKISGRLKIIECLTNFYRSVIVLTPEDLLPCVYLSLNQLAPAYEGIELGIGDMILIKSIAETTGRTPDRIKSDMKKLGDLGIVAESSKTTQMLMISPAPLLVHQVFAKLKQIAATSGSCSVNQKVKLVKSLLVACKSFEARYLIRSLTGKLRIGLAEQSVVVALANAVTLTPPGQDFPPAVINKGNGMSNDQLKSLLEESTLLLKSTLCELPNFDKVISSILEHGIDYLPYHCKLTPGIPLKPMLANPTNGVEEVINRFDKCAFTCEYKYDGERAQIHVLEDAKIEIYSRNQEKNTSKYPDVIQRLPRVLKHDVKSCIIDSEAVAWDTQKKQILPFQVLSTRKRKDANLSDITIQVCIYAFDLLYLNGNSLIHQPFRKRRELLISSINAIEGEFMLATSCDSSNTDEIAEFLEESIRSNCEGLMVKTLDHNASYEIAKRSHNWLKLKKDYLDGVCDTLDLLVIGGYHGKGKRTGLYGGFLLACYDPESDEYQSICKIGTGFSDQALFDHTKFFKDHISQNSKPYYRLNEATADEWFEPVQVWEVKAADLSISPVYAAASGIVDSNKGVSLRFPRFIGVRKDKKPEDSTSSRQVADMYYQQEQVRNRLHNDSKATDFY